MKEINKPLTWLEIQQMMFKPVWDNKYKQWRVVKGYSECKDGKNISFTDSTFSSDFDEKRFYLEEKEK